MYEIILDVFAYMMFFRPCVFLFPRKRKRGEVRWCSDFVSNWSSCRFNLRRFEDSETVGNLSEDDDDGGGSENVGKTNEFAFFQT